MTEKEKRTILDMRAAGRQYKEISEKLGIDVSALKVFVHRQKHEDVRRCEQCRKALPRAFLSLSMLKLRRYASSYYLLLC